MLNSTILLLILLILLFILYMTSNYSENFNVDRYTMYIFLSKNCPHCVNYDNGVHNKLMNDIKTLKTNIDVKKIYAHEDSDNLFDKYNIQYVPAALVMKKDKNMLVNGEINVDNISKTIQNM